MRDSIQWESLARYIEWTPIYLVTVAYWAELGIPLNIPVVSIEDKQLQSFNFQDGDFILNMSEKIKRFSAQNRSLSLRIL